MSPDTFARLDELFERTPVLRGGDASADEVDAAERSVGVQFDADYRAFVLRYGGAMVGSLPIFGLRRAEVMGDDAFEVTTVTARFRADGWEPTKDWVVISMDLAGNPIGLNPAGEVWLADHDSGETRILARTFEQFVLMLLNE